MTKAHHLKRKLLIINNTKISFNQRCHDVISCGSKVNSHMAFTAYKKLSNTKCLLAKMTASKSHGLINCHWDEWKCWISRFSFVHMAVWETFLETAIVFAHKLLTTALKCVRTVVMHKKFHSVIPDPAAVAHLRNVCQILKVWLEYWNKRVFLLVLITWWHCRDLKI